VLATSAFAQSAKDIRGANPYIEIPNEPAPKLIVDPPLPEALAQGIFWAQYRVENVRIVQVFGALKWGLIPHWCQDPSGGRRPINARAENVPKLPMFREAYSLRRCVVPVDGFFEWRAVKGGRAKQPYAIAMKDGSPFGLAGLWENWRDPKTGDWERTFVIITVPSNELVRQIHDRMPAILEPASYDRWLGLELDPHDLLITYPSEPMTMWPISTRVNKPENDDPSLLDRTGDPFDVWAPLKSDGRA
jgi:putative SOS response-associated peptidase YedK